MTNKRNWYYFSKYGVTINGKHSFRDFDLLPRKKPVIPAPEVKKYEIDIPGIDGSLDYTDALTGDVFYENVEGEFEFTYIGKREHWDSVYHKIKSAWHGKKAIVIMDEDKTRYYTGRLFVGEPEWKDGDACFELTGSFYPYMLDMQTSSDRWLWDPFNFETDVIRQYLNLPVSTQTKRLIVGSDRPTIPVFTVSNDMTMYYYSTVNTQEYPKIIDINTWIAGAKSVTLLANTQNVVDDLILRGREYELVFAGSGTVTINFRGGRL